MYYEVSIYRFRFISTTRDGRFILSCSALLISFFDDFAHSCVFAAFHFLSPLPPFSILHPPALFCLALSRQFNYVCLGSSSSLRLQAPASSSPLFVFYSIPCLHLRAFFVIFVLFSLHSESISSRFPARPFTGLSTEFPALNSPASI